MLTFRNMWENHPRIQGNDTPCTTNGKKNFNDQCAIRMGTCLSKCGVNTTQIVPRGRHCWQHDSSQGHILAAEELATGLKNNKIPGINNFEEIDPKKYFDVLDNRQGIIFFKDFWCRTVNGKKEIFRNRSGDHIDLWNGSRLTDWKTWFFISNTLNWGSEYTKAKEIWFWEVR